MLKVSRVTPVEAKDLCKNRAVLGPTDETGVQGPVEILSLGEASGLLLILGGIFLWIRRDFDWRIPVSILLTVAVFSAVLGLFDAERFPTPLFSIFSGGLLLGAIYMATDPVTSPVTPRGAWVFGIGVGVLVMLIRVFGGLPEGVMYAILLMNAATPLINRYTQPRVFGREARSP